MTNTNGLLDRLPAPEHLKAFCLLERSWRICGLACDREAMFQASRTAEGPDPELETDWTEEAVAALFLLFSTWGKDVFAIWIKVWEFADTGLAATAWTGGTSDTHNNSRRSAIGPPTAALSALHHRPLTCTSVSDEMCVDAVLTLIRPIRETAHDRIYVLAILAWHFASHYIDAAAPPWKPHTQFDCVGFGLTRVTGRRASPRRGRGVAFTLRERDPRGIS